MGSRYAAALSKLKCKLESAGITLRHVYTDDYPVYSAADFRQHTIGKAHTHGVERDNARTRHWFARFRRRSLVVSKSAEMIDLTIKLYAHYHFDNHLTTLKSILM